MKYFYTDENHNKKEVGENLELLYLMSQVEYVTELHVNGHPNLKTICVNTNKLTNVNLECPYVYEIYLRGNKITNLSLKCPELKDLCCYGNPIETLNLQCPKLEYLKCDVSLFPDMQEYVKEGLLVFDREGIEKISALEHINVKLSL